MPCYHPIAAYQRRSGGRLSFSFKSMPHDARHLEIPCGQCIGCKLEFARRWAVRCMHEAKMHESNCFVTLTYDDDHLPPDLSLCHPHFVAFFKRLREYLRSIGHPPIRFFMGGEYGEKYSRPHYHSLIFGFYPEDKVFWKMSDSGYPVYTSALLDKAWRFGRVYVGDVTFESASYVARYCLKKSNDGYPRREILDVTTGEIITRAHEYGKMSLRPGIGASFVEKYARDIFMNDRVVVNGHVSPLPRYYDILLERESPLLLAEHKAKRRFKSELRNARVAELHPELPIGSRQRLYVEEVVKLASISLLKRGD